MTPQDASRRMRELCSLAPVVPVLVIDDISHARPLAAALVAGGLPVLEVTLRTPVALQAIREMALVPGAVVGAGTVLGARDVAAARAAGARFAVSPGATPALLAACEAEDMPILPGAATASEVMTLLDRGYDMAKFFPADAIGGAPALRALGGPLPQMAFCPTGGIGADTAAEYLALPNVICVGGSWIAPKGLVHRKDWRAIQSLAQAAKDLQPAGK
ncbi:2-keto-3-deoxy-phosphogluconate aldolase [Gemmobacter megaterium]|uniref:2-dehydro-3-deoxy-phosphogluconate aldolase n=1 Tax=Gemmobacter megaterium TaxID=1086013 RepID=A0A1N7KCW0_9RHOB|nr:bifunctional 4-hydroxy-2-oxoglutarate aldolase/2-dehydro-3-deoxy-phosphogluconate aldolase [Gemmobacter megaterium]SIS59446.1 2-keto-3-deoxy-phosphogluconate aldolase [Gemmobacter megaterium]